MEDQGEATHPVDQEMTKGTTMEVTNQVGNQEDYQQWRKGADIARNAANHLNP